MTTPTASPKILIRDLVSLEDLRQLQRVEKEVWEMGDEDSLPMTLAIALQATGSIFVGAFEGEKMVGFAFGIIGREHGQITIHSHMLAVLELYRQHDLGLKLKQAQRERALALGIREMTWTYDPLQSRNAHLNFAKLGIVSDMYKVNFYGPETSSALHRNGTDRLWVRWLLDSRRTRDRLEGKNGRSESLDAMRLLAPLVSFNGDGRPARADLAESLARQRVSIEIPGEILEVERTDMGLAREWREATRWAFGEAVAAGFYVAEFCRAIRGQQGPGAYLLEKGSVGEVVGG
jgi:predicted GNAT superfamily acetyltransferase